MISDIPFQLTDHVGSEPTYELLMGWLIRNNRRYLRTESWPSQALSLDPIDDPGEVHLQYQADGRESILQEVGGAMCRLGLEDGRLVVNIGAMNREEADEALARVRADYPPDPLVRDDQRVPLSIWTLTKDGPRNVRRLIDVPTWEEVEANYPMSVADKVRSLMATKPVSGRIILWHGPPGTGKSYALRALAYEWREWADFHYIVDPDTMFGEQASYMVSVLFDEGGALLPAGEAAKLDDRWRVLILEDTGEMLTVDAKEHVGQGLSRLLNVTDGLIGQGLRVLVLVTTNEEVGKLHPAVSRPGRAAAKTLFGPFERDEAAAWCEARGILLPGNRDAWTLAELYSLARGETPSEPVRTGFRLAPAASGLHGRRAG